MQGAELSTKTFGSSSNNEPWRDISNKLFKLEKPSLWSIKMFYFFFVYFIRIIIIIRKMTCSLWRAPVKPSSSKVPLKRRFSVVAYIQYPVTERVCVVFTQLKITTRVLFKYVLYLILINCIRTSKINSFQI